METKLFNDVFPSKFEVTGFFLEIFIGNQFVGSIPSDYIPNRKTGYVGREKITLEADIITSTKKRVKKGTEVMTYYMPMCGRRIWSVLTT